MKTRPTATPARTTRPSKPGPTATRKPGELPAGAITKAAQRALGRIKSDPKMTSSASSAGFIIPAGQKAGRLKGYQVFVKVCRYSDEKLKEDKMSGGLFCEV